MMFFTENERIISNRTDFMIFYKIQQTFMVPGKCNIRNVINALLSTWDVNPTKSLFFDTICTAKSGLLIAIP